ncbi:LPXTG cell wall anchor domain-containing protein [Levilactobacillus senmaizukei]|uniref:LPXTG cell wall anchor domain-containing protein n=1 Tax=Levilactobacillus senmaizukei TaxID=431273 RepID=UPI00077BD44A|nr:LPXTG cell wall anchor domain-containing protein [Levilactobacillus senmaizukei]
MKAYGRSGVKANGWTYREGIQPGLTRQPGHSVAGQRPTATDLPQTNDSTTGWSWIGAMLLTILSWLGLANHRRQG